MVSPFATYDALSLVITQHSYIWFGSTSVAKIPAWSFEGQFNCKVLAGGDAGQEQLREEPEGSQLASLAPESLQLVARLQGEKEESALLPLLSTSC